MKKLLICLLCLCVHVLHAQVYNNEWIDHNKTYYKLKVGKTGLHRVAKNDLAAAGLGNIPVEQLQLWRNGREVPLYTPVASGILPDGAFIEFWGHRNDGKADRPLYRRPEYQLNDAYSLQTDTSVYFLTINTSGGNRRLVSTANTLDGNTLAPEPYFIHTVTQAFANQLNGGYAVDVNQYLYSAAYDLGEGYSSGFIGTNGSNTINLGNLFVATTGPAATFKISVAGNKIAQRRYRVRINNDSIVGNQVDFFNAATDSAQLPLAVISTATNNVQVTNITSTASDRLAIYRYDLTYPRQFNFGNLPNFEFALPASAGSRYLEITAFANGGLPPVLLDVNNGLRLVGDISVAGRIRFLLPPMSQEGRMVLYSQVATNLTTITSITERKFVDYSNAANQGDYLIISNRILFGGSSGNAVEAYSQYRSSAAGGAYNTRVYDVEEFVDQFGLGVKKTPLGIRNFIQFAMDRFAVKPRHVLLMGKGTVYTEQRGRESDPNINLLNLVPTFGNPASDILLAAAPGTAVPRVSIGRLSVVNGKEIQDYLEKVKQYEAAQSQQSPDVADMLWKKNVAHIIGSGDPNLQTSLEQYMSVCKSIISDTLWGADVHTFTKKSGANVEQISDKALEQLFAEGMSFMTYFGHSSSSGLDYNLDNPDAYNNTGKYPLFTALGCDAGNFFRFNTSRFSIKDAISEKYVLAPQKGTIGFIASSHFGVVSTLQIWNTQFYENVAREQYGKTIGELMTSTAAKVLGRTVNGEENYLVRVNVEETVYHGDPALLMNVQPKPDYVITDAMVRVDPTFVSIADTSFRLLVDVQNTGKAINKKIVLQVKRQFPDLTEQEVVRDTIAAPKLAGSYAYPIRLNGVQDKGMNKLTITVDSDAAVDELFETNNTVTREVFVYEDEARPIFPYNFGIVNKPDVKLSISTANPFSESRAYQVEMDTTELFNSPLKWTNTVTSPGGLLEVQPGLGLRNNTVYYWRVAVVPDNGEFRWNKSSFVYLQDGGEGFNQSHLYQHLKSGKHSLEIDSSSREWNFGTIMNSVFGRNGVYPTTNDQGGFYTVYLNDNPILGPGCNYNEIIFNVVEPVRFTPWKNNYSGPTGLYNSIRATCGSGRDYNFQYFLTNSTERKKAMDFIDAIPVGHYVVVRSNSNPNNNANTFSKIWESDTALFGSGKSLYHKLYNEGIANIDSFNKARSWIFLFKKGGKNIFTPVSIFSQGIYDPISLNALCPTSDTSGTVASPLIGPAKAWNNLVWDGTSKEQNSKDEFKLKVLGLNNSGTVDTVLTINDRNNRNIDLRSIDVGKYKYLGLRLETSDMVDLTPLQLKYWRINYTPLPEGAIAPNLFFQLKDTLEVGDDLEFKMAFKNVSTTGFDSLRIKMVVTDQNNVAHELPILKQKPLVAGDTLHVRTAIDSKLFAGANTLFVYVNPDNDQPEQYQFNNFLYGKFFVNDDRTPPVVDVTFDNIRILNRDIVSSKPDILIKLTDESRRLLLNDTALLSVKVRNLGTNATRSYNFDNDTLRFVPATQPGRNEASVAFKPYFAEDGEYELVVTGKDRRGNEAGGTAYRVSFQVINKPMISNMLNYPNPFTTSTAFVFTLTGSEVPNNLKIQILTITGKVVREITRQELGSLRIGRNITEFKWDGTDQFGQRLANGVYLYRVVAQLDGKNLDKYQAANDPTDQYFNKGYGKMYLMR